MRVSVIRIRLVLRVATVRVGPVVYAGVVASRASRVWRVGGVASEAGVQAVVESRRHLDRTSIVGPKTGMRRLFQLCHDGVGHRG